MKKLLMVVVLVGLVALFAKAMCGQHCHESEI